MPTEPSNIAGLFVIRHPTRDDGRGFFRQFWVASELAAAVGTVPEFVQSNHARSEPGVLRGFHAEPWDKLVYVPRGRVLAVVADLRPESATFATTAQYELGDGSDRAALFVSRGLGNAYVVLGETSADYVYTVTQEWRSGTDKGAVAWDDPTLGVDWPVSAPVLSDEDRAAPTLRSRFPDHDLFREDHR